jgi:protein-L-isoaspartate(D-aspartate) O-methyltransferase
MTIMNAHSSKRQYMVDTQIIPRGIKNLRVIEAMRKVPRHLFLDEALWPQAYEDHPLPIGEKQTISQPYIVAFMTEALGLTGKEKVLEIGSGSGYQTAILAELAEQVYTIERIPAIAKRARKLFDQLQYRNIIITIVDGTSGWKEHSPYDGIIVTAASPSTPRPLLEQLATGGRLVIPIGDEFNQELMVYEKEDGNEFKEENYGGCRFVKLVGEHGWKK